MRLPFHYARSRALIPGTYHPGKIETQVREQVARYVPLPRRDHGRDTAGPRLVFVVGMPRSGTTLVESIFLRHPSVASIGKSTALAECFAQWRLSLAG